MTFVRDFCREFAYPPEAEAALCAALEAVYAAPDARAVWEWELSRYERDETHNLYDGFYALRPVLKTVAAPQETTELLFFILCAAHLRQLYAERGYTGEMYRNAMTDLRCKLLECHRLRGVWGSYVDHWFCGFYSLERVALGRLQFELRPMPACISPDGQYAFRGGELSVNVHIPSSGPLETAAVLDAYRQAAAFFADRFPGDAVLLRCHSWLLFPELEQILGDKSNIVKFSKLFSPIKAIYRKGFSNAWRVFGKPYNGSSADMPKDTSMQRAFLKHLDSGNCLCIGIGMLLFDGEKIL